MTVLHAMHAMHAMPVHAACRLGRWGRAPAHVLKLRGSPLAHRTPLHGGMCTRTARSIQHHVWGTAPARAPARPAAAAAPLPDRHLVAAGCRLPLGPHRPDQGRAAPALMVGGWVGRVGDRDGVGLAALALVAGMQLQGMRGSMQQGCYWGHPFLFKWRSTHPAANSLHDGGGWSLLLGSCWGKPPPARSAFKLVPDPW